MNAFFALVVLALIASVASFSRVMNTRAGTALNSLSRFKSPYASGAAAPAPKAAPAAKSVGKSFGKSAGKAVAAAPKKDMTWGGRPDAAPEMIVIAGQGLNAPWRLNQKKANEN